MFEKLQKHWKVGATQLFLILCVFAITGTTTAYISRMITTWIGLTSDSPLWPGFIVWLSNYYFIGIHSVWSISIFLEL
jgi:hypothetical protein